VAYLVLRDLTSDAPYAVDSSLSRFIVIIITAALIRLARKRICLVRCSEVIENIYSDT